MIKRVLAAAIIGATAMGAQASTNLLTDGDFESTGLSFSSSSYCYAGNVPAPQCGSAPYTVNGWSGVNTVYMTSSSSPWGTPDAQAHTNIDLGNVVAGIQSTSSLVSSFMLTAGDTYVISWDDAGRQGYGGVQTYSVTAGGALVSGQDFTTDAGAWESHTYTVTATSDSALVFQGLATNDSTSFIDNVSVSAVPEPSMLLMMGIGVMGMLAWRRRSQLS